MKKHCPHCMMTKPLTDFHRDSKGKDGRSVRCANCRNLAKRKKNPYKEYNGKPKEAVKPITETVTIKVTPEPDDNIFAKIYQKHQRFFTAQYSPNKLVLAFHGSPTTVVKGTVDEVLSEVLGD